MSKKFFSRKYSKILTFASMAETFNESCDEHKNKLMIHTANGIYLGNLKHMPKLDNLDIQKNDDMLTCFYKIYSSGLDKYENSNEYNPNAELIENPITIELEDVELITSGKTINMPFVSIFVDQIVGISLGNV